MGRMREVLPDNQKGDTDYEDSIEEIFRRRWNLGCHQT